MKCKTKRGENFEVLAMDKISNYALVESKSAIYQPYIVVYMPHFNESNFYWEYGSYFSEKDDAHECFVKKCSKS